MNTKYPLLTTLALVFSINVNAKHTTSSKIIYEKPQEFSDFRLSFKQRPLDTKFLIDDLNLQIEKIASQILPNQHQILIKFHDIDMAGNIVSHADIRKTKKYLDKSVLNFEYAIVDAEQNIIKYGKEKLIETNLLMKSLRMKKFRYTEFDHELLQFSNWLNKVSKTL